MSVGRSETLYFRTQTVGNNESYDLLLFELMFARSQVIKSNDEMGPVLIGNATFKGEEGGAVLCARTESKQQY